MKLQFTHFSLNGISGAASAVIKGPAPSSNLDRAPYFEVQVGYYIVPKGVYSDLRSDSAAHIPGEDQVVHLNFIVEQIVPGSDRNQDAVEWPASGEYRAAFTRMLAGMLAHRQTDLQGKL